MVLADLLISILHNNSSVDQASLPLTSEKEKWHITKPIRVILNSDLPLEKSTMGKFCLLLRSRSYIGATDVERSTILQEINTLLEGGARLPTFMNWTSSLELAQLFKNVNR